MEDTKLAYSVEELAKKLSIGLSGAYNLVKSEGFPKITVGRRVIIPAAPLDIWLERQAQAGREVAG